MNCKPGELAVIVRSAAGNEGRIVEVMDSDVRGLPGSESWMPAPLWRVRSLGHPLPSDLGNSWSVFAFPDVWLRPIRNPGDDAQDETLAWKPVPLPAIQPELLGQS